MDETKVFDKAKWHSDGDFPKGLSADQAFVHTGLFLGWIIDSELYSEDFATSLAAEIDQFKGRRLTGPGVYRSGDGVFMDEMLNPEGLEFTTEYFDFQTGKYLQDYEKLFADGLPSMYHVQDTWENYDRLKPQLDKQFASWRKNRGLG